jgi:hypothetical protein
MKPIEGAETEGALGFFKGVGKGLVGYCSLFIRFLIPNQIPCQRGHQARYWRV